MSDDVILNVPYADKDKAKALGAKWNPKIKRWYIKDNQDISKFSTWLPPESNCSVSVAYSPIFLIKSWERCWNCAKISNVYGLAASGFQEAEDSVIMNNFFIFSFVEYMPMEVKKYLTKTSTTYFVDYSKTTNSYYLMNHCEHCQKGFGDFYMHGEPESAFVPMHSDECKKVYISRLPVEVCEIAGSYHSGEPEDLILEHANFVNLDEIFEDFNANSLSSEEQNYQEDTFKITEITNLDKYFSEQYILDSLDTNQFLQNSQIRQKRSIFKKLLLNIFKKINQFLNK